MTEEEFSDIKEDIARAKEELAKIIRHAHLIGYNWIQIDRDGPRLDGFPVYDW